MSGIQERVENDLVESMSLGASVFAFYESTRMEVTEIMELTENDRYNEALPKIDRGVTTLETRLSTSPEIRRVFEYSLHDYYVQQAICYTKLGENSVDLKKKAIESLEKSVSVFRITDSPKDFQNIFGWQNDLKSEIKELEKKKCFIATAVMGNDYAPEVETLRCFRDVILRRYQLGRDFIIFYERISPPLAERIAANNFIRRCEPTAHS
jgi:hypothetical protein